MPITSKPSLVAIAAAAALLAAAGVAYATIPDSNGVIHGCYATKDGSLRVIDPNAAQSCDAKETALDWNQTGPQGAQGPAGPQGPSDAWFSDQKSVSVPSLGDEVVTSVTVPAGSYLLSSQVIASGSSATTGVFCLFSSPTPATTVSQSFTDQTLATSVDEDFAMTGTATVTTGRAEIDIECQNRPQPSQSSYSATANLTAQQVGTLH